jgi:hypothetical protein
VQDGDNSAKAIVAFVDNTAIRWHDRDGERRLLSCLYRRHAALKKGASSLFARRTRQLPVDGIAGRQKVSSGPWRPVIAAITTVADILP